MIDTKWVNKDKGIVLFLDRLIGKGTNGEVYEGAINYKQPNEKKIAVKVITKVEDVRMMN